MNVLVVTQYFSPESFRINEVVASLQQAGCSVTVLTGQPNYPDGRIFPGYRAWHAGPDERAAGFRVVRVPLFPRGTGSAWRLAANYLSFVCSASLVGAWQLRRQRFDVLFVYGISPILQAIPAILLRRQTRGRVVTWVQDLWPQSLEVTGFVRNPHLLAGVAAVVRWIYRRSDLLLVQSRSFVQEVAAMAGSTAVRYHPNPGELAFTQPMRAGPPPIEYQPGFNVVFAGNLGTVQALDTLLAAAELLLNEPDIHFVLVGSGSRGNWLLQEIERRKLTNVRLAGRLPPEAMPAVLGAASALLVSLVRSPIMSRTIPSKVQAYLAAGRPIVACLDGEGARVVEEAGAGLACAAEDAQALAGTVLRLRNMQPEQLQRMGAAGRCYYQQNFDPDYLAQRLVEHFRSIEIH
ncbi:MAG: glycosyltransferase family 4 protein [Proteobacteria bacterium]|nr:glycosyltransferase family 4 protein [Pseudomonadota bacterium]